MSACIKCLAQSDRVNVYRWYNAANNEYVTGTEADFLPEQAKWKEKTFLRMAYNRPAIGRIAIYSWYNPATKDHAAIKEGEFTDEQMKKMGYGQKHLQYYIDKG
jgi:hypothetical protein